MLKIRSSDTQSQTDLIEKFKNEKTCLSEYFQKNPKVYSANPSVKTELFAVATIKRTESDRNLRLGKFSTQNVSRQFLKNRSTIKLFDKVPAESMPPLHIVNQEEAKRNFLESNIPPVLIFKADNIVVQNILFKHNKPSYNYFFKAKHILDLVKSKFKNGAAYFDANFGPKITSKQSVDIIASYLTENKISGDITINFAPGLTCSGRIVSFNTVKNDPETRKFTIWINDGEENQFLRRKGIISLCDHEIGTHYYRSYNDGLQIWYSCRKQFGIRALNSVELLRTEEGLAALHTVMNANLKFLFLPALFYYLACMADTLTFEQLFNHMEEYVEDPDERWKLVTRVKRGISDPHQIGCYSRDQSYFEGAVKILENLDSIDFNLLMSGKICVDELLLVKKMARTEKLKLPKFLENIEQYKERLRYIAIVNGIIAPRIINKNQLIIKDMITDSDVILENLKTARSTNDKTNKDIEFQQINSIEENLNDYKIMYNLNKKCDSLDSDDIKTYINKEIVLNTKNVPINKPLSSSIHHNSSFCVVL